MADKKNGPNVGPFWYSYSYFLAAFLRRFFVAAFFAVFLRAGFLAFATLAFLTFLRGLAALVVFLLAFAFVALRALAMTFFPFDC